MLTPELVQQRLSNYHPQAAEHQVERHAAVAMLLRQGTTGLELLLIQRAEHELDPWSGDLGFPGGGIEDSDRSARAAAEREVFEEIGIRLMNSDYLGRTDDLNSGRMSLNISCFIYFLTKPVSFKLNETEVKSSFWVPLTSLVQPDRGDLIHFQRPGINKKHPVVHLKEWSSKPLWGITYHLINNFLNLFDLSLTNSEWI
jgi:8-oxo-dGTP pyrophosphatase MutT (NUDIX family)